MKYVERKWYGIKETDIIILLLLVVMLCFTICLIIDFDERNPISPQNVRIRIQEINYDINPTLEEIADEGNYYKH